MTTKIDKNTFLQLILDNKKLIYKVCHAYCHHQDDREELVQEIIIQLWKASASYDPQYKLSTWMYRISLNVAISFHRKEQRRVQQTLPFNESIIDSVALEQTDDNQSAEIQQLYRFINRLDELNRALILLYLDRHSHKEIAEILGISETNVATKIGRIKHKLKQDFSTVE